MQKKKKKTDSFRFSLLWCLLGVEMIIASFFPYNFFVSFVYNFFVYIFLFLLDHSTYRNKRGNSVCGVYCVSCYFVYVEYYQWDYYLEIRRNMMNYCSFRIKNKIVSLIHLFIYLITFFSVLSFVYLRIKNRDFIKLSIKST